MFLTAEITDKAWDILTYLCVLRAFFASSAVKKTEKGYTQFIWYSPELLNFTMTDLNMANERSLL